MSKNFQIIESVVVRYLFSSKKKRSKYSSYTVIIILNEKHRDFIEKVENAVCPFCGRKFESKTGLRSHMAVRGPCYEAFKLFLEDLYREYLRIKNTIKWNSGKAKVVTVHPYKKFRTWREAVMYLLKN